MELITLAQIIFTLAVLFVFLRWRISRKWFTLPNDKHSNDLFLSDISQRVVIITGGNVGLGYECALELFRRHAHVILACRNILQGQQACASIVASSSTKSRGSVECVHVDLASLSSVHEFADKIKSKHSPESIHAIILNAGVWIPEEAATNSNKGNPTAKTTAKTEDGFEMHFGVNHLAHFELAKLFQEYLQTTKTTSSGNADKSSRIVFVTSSLLKYGTLDMQTREFLYKQRHKINNGDSNKNKAPSFAPTGYCDSKLMNALTCKRLAEILQQDNPNKQNVTTYSVCPGFCQSKLNRHVSFPIYQRLLLWPIFRLVQRTTRHGAHNILYLVLLANQDTLVNGAVYSDGRVLADQTRHVNSFGDGMPTKLWDLSEKLIQEVATKQKS